METQKGSAGTWIIIVVIVIIILAAGYYFLAMQPASNNGTAMKSGVQSTTGQSQTQQVEFANTPDAKNAYLISTATYDAATLAALSGFKVNRTVLTDGTQQITLTAQNPEYHDQSYSVKPGEKLYFIEKFSGDDVNGEDLNTGDDTAVLVDANGYVVQ